uniref:Putative monotil peptide n=1 Tax=Rhipicephalus pulchellus TaxID=72859 RepID=L7LTB4_RHIPC
MGKVMVLNFSLIVIVITLRLTVTAIESPSVNLPVPRSQDPSSAAVVNPVLPGGGEPTPAPMINAASPGANGRPGPALTSNGKYLCGRHERYKTCQSSTCGEKNCRNRFRLFPKCTKDCVSKCFCRRRFYRNEKGHCVRFYQCGKWIKSLKEHIEGIFKSRAE